MATSTLSPGTAEIDPDVFGELIDNLRRDAKKAPAKHARVFRVRITAHEVVVETTYVDDRGKDRVRVLQRARIAKKPPVKRNSKYDQLRAEFEKAALAHRVAPGTLASHQQKHSNAIQAYWQQPPAE